VSRLRAGNFSVRCPDMTLGRLPIGRYTVAISADVGVPAMNHNYFGIVAPQTSTIWVVDAAATLPVATIIASQTVKSTQISLTKPKSTTFATLMIKTTTCTITVAAATKTQTVTVTKPKAKARRNAIGLTELDIQEAAAAVSDDLLPGHPNLNKPIDGTIGPFDYTYPPIPRVTSFAQAIVTAVSIQTSTITIISQPSLGTVTLSRTSFVYSTTSVTKTITTTVTK
jgi:uncharacterized membrane protein